ncbi:hypothetical protein FJ444_18995 [Aestuariibacter sp. GS-14]|uniref:aldolase/citrate lyase family protein n=1 Tax=Aestuariibacter sp. GS-14 TaxID=2590670 RepID=UPI00112843ED|nr:aldolase/citrate lyase family protein [Aestuariibacter sp. GS-14]TPV54276.1 hypothetical protein FJ444_18995 [Aestuariibacter sp. GS-14]
MMNKKQIGMYLFCDSEAQIMLAEKAGIDGIMLDWETRGKESRQSGYDTQINNLNIEVLNAVRKYSQKPLMVRVNGFYEGTHSEVELAVSGGATQVLLPIAHSAKEVEEFISIVGDKAEPCIMIETQSLLDDIASLKELPWKTAFIGLNDLMISRSGNYIWDPLIDGTVDWIYEQLPGRELGFGGITLLEYGYPLPFKLLVKEMARLGCSFSFLRRSFYRDIQTLDPRQECNKVREYWDTCLARSITEIQNDRDIFIQTAQAIKNAL